MAQNRNSTLLLLPCHPASWRRCTGEVRMCFWKEVNLCIGSGPLIQQTVPLPQVNLCPDSTWCFHRPGKQRRERYIRTEPRFNQLKWMSYHFESIFPMGPVPGVTSRLWLLKNIEAALYLRLFNNLWLLKGEWLRSSVIWIDSH